MNPRTVLPRRVIARCLLVAVTGIVLARTVRSQEDHALVVTVPIIEREIAATANFVASVKPLRQTIVGSAVDGRVEQFLADDSNDEVRVTRVTKGQVLARLRTETIAIELAAAQAQLRILQQAWMELKNGSRPEEIAQTRAKMLGAQARMKFARAKYDRTKRLHSQRQTSREEHDLAFAQAIEADQAYLEAKANHELIVAGPRVERLSQAEARVQAQQDAVRLITDSLDKHTIRAPFDGYVVSELTEIGAWLQKGDPVTEIVQLNVVELESFIAERYVVAVEPGMQVGVRVEAIAGRQFFGQLDRIIPQAEERSRTFPVRVRLDNPAQGAGHLLKVGMSATISLAVGAPTRVLLAPKDALVLGGPSPHIVVVDDNKGHKSVRVVEVELGVADGDLIEVQGMVRVGQHVVVQGNERLRDGQQIKISPRSAAG